MRPPKKARTSHNHNPINLTQQDSYLEIQTANLKPERKKENKTNKQQSEHLTTLSKCQKQR